jgi:hypothetical protein
VAILAVGVLLLVMLLATGPLKGRVDNAVPGGGNAQTSDVPPVGAVPSQPAPSSTAPASGETRAPARNTTAPPSGVTASPTGVNPPVGTIWFAKDYATSGIVGPRLTSVRLGDRIVWVAATPSGVGDQAQLQVLQGTKMVTGTNFTFPFSGLVISAVFEPKLYVDVPGTYTVRLEDGAGHAVAKGSIKITR